MGRLTRDTVLLRRPDLTFRLDSDNEPHVLVDGEDVRCGPWGLAVLAAFAHPRTLAQGLEALETKGRQGWVELTSTVHSLFAHGLLCEGAETAPPRGEPLGFSGWKVHQEMLGDRARTASYLAAIAEVVRPGDVVVDLGTGTGVLAVAAARAGARRVFAIEAGGMAAVARRVFAANGVADRVTLLEGWSTRLDLPEPADVVVSEIIGNDPLGERVLELLNDALERLARPAARLVPSRLRLYALPVSVPEAHWSERLPAPATLERWREWYGIDLSPFGAVVQAGEAPVLYLKSQEAADWPRLAEPALVLDRVFERGMTFRVDERVAVRATKAGRLSGILLYFELRLSPAVALSTHPALASPGNCWRSPVWLLKEPRTLAAGEPFELRYQYGVVSRSSRLQVR